MKIIGDIAIIHNETPLITDVQSVIDLLASIRYEHHLAKIAMNKEAINVDFFNLSTGFAGEVVQKFVNYRFSVAIIGDFSEYTSKALRDFMYECNQGTHLFFVSDENEAVRKLSR